MITPEQNVKDSTAEARPAADAPPGPDLKSPPDVETPASTPSSGLESNAVASTSAPAVDESLILPIASSETETPTFKFETVSSEAATAQATVPPTATATAQPTTATLGPVTTQTLPTVSATVPTQTLPIVAAEMTPANPAPTPSKTSVPAPLSADPAVAAPEHPTGSPPEQPTGTASAPTQPEVAAPAQPEDLAPYQISAPVPTQPTVVAAVELEDPAPEQLTVPAPTPAAQLKDPAPTQAQPTADPAPTQVMNLARVLSTVPPPAQPEVLESSTQPTAAAPVPSPASAVTNLTVAAPTQPTGPAPTQLVTASVPTNAIAVTLIQPAVAPRTQSIGTSAPTNTAVAAPTKPPAQPTAAVPSAQPPKPSVSESQSLQAPIPSPQLSNASVLAVPPVITRRPPAPEPAEPIPPVTSSMPPRAPASKSKKKKVPPVVTMATAPMAQPSALGDQGENTGRWTSEEHRLFLQGLDQHGKGWKKIASLIKSRTVVQIRTHAQKYFQKLSKARQNGEEGDVTMEGRGGVASVTSVSSAAGAALSGKRRRPTTGTKRKAIHSVVASAQREGKRLAAAQANIGEPDPVPPLPAVAPILAYFALPYASDVPATGNGVPSIPAAHGSISGPALEDSLFRFLTPMPIAPLEPAQVNDVARQAGANSITLPTEQTCCSPMMGGGEISPTGVFELDLYPTWPDNRDPPSWYAKGSDIDALLDVGGSLDWLEDTGDLHESYQLPAGDSAGVAELGHTTTRNSTSVSTLPHVDSNVGSVVPPLPSLFDGAPSSQSLHHMHHVNASMSSTKLHESTSTSGMDEHLQVFDTPMEEDDFVSTILENANESSGSFNVLS